jgi:hypothetical protein
VLIGVIAYATTGCINKVTVPEIVGATMVGVGASAAIATSGIATSRACTPNRPCYNGDVPEYSGSTTPMEHERIMPVFVGGIVVAGAGAVVLFADAVVRLREHPAREDSRAYVAHDDGVDPYSSLLR